VGAGASYAVSAMGRRDLRAVVVGSQKTLRSDMHAWGTARPQAVK